MNWYRMRIQLFTPEYRSESVHFFSADSFAAAQIAVLRDARRPTPPGMAAAQRSIGPLTEYEQVI